MNPNQYFTDYWDSEQIDQLFVCMPMPEDGLSKKKFTQIKEAACSAGFKRGAERADDISHAEVSMTTILNGLANSRALLFDVSDDLRYKTDSASKVNSNVMYELGIALARREVLDIIVVREGNPPKTPFDIRGITMYTYNGRLCPKELQEKLTKLREDQDWSRSERVRRAAKRIDFIGIQIIRLFALKGQIFNTQSFYLEQKLSVHRLLDLGIVKLNAQIRGEKGEIIESTYGWTGFGRAVAKLLDEEGSI